VADPHRRDHRRRPRRLDRRSRLAADGGLPDAHRPAAQDAGGRHELARAVRHVERVLQLCDTYFEDTRTIVVEREKELASVVQVLRQTLADLAGQAKSFNVDLIRSTDRIGTLANVDDIRELKRLIASEARELKHAVVEKQRRDDVLFTQMSKRVDALQTQQAEAQRQAELDPLTEIANRRGFDRTIREWSLLAARSKQPFSVAMVDIDDFKPAGGVSASGTASPTARTSRRCRSSAWRSRGRSRPARSHRGTRRGGHRPARSVAAAG
jgi:hypothetical protein